MKVLITYDFLATSPSLGRNLSNALSFIKKILYTLDIEVNIDNGDFEQEKFYDSINLKIVDRKKFVVLKEHMLNKTSFKILENYIKNYDLLITYELSIETRRIFDKQRISYIDFWLAPIRFYSDLMFNIYSNIPEVQYNIKKYKINEELFFAQSKLISNQFEYFKLHEKLNLVDNSLLLVGQLFEDRSVIKDGKFLTLLDYKERLKELSKIYNKIYFQKHPLMSSQNFQLYFNEFKEISNIEYLENINTYELLSRNEIKKVVSISSSVLYEAKFFSKEIEYFYKSVIDENYIMIYKDYFKTSFWMDILSVNNKHIDVELLNYDNFFRHKLCAFWGYQDLIEENNIIYNNKQSYSKLVSFYNFCENLPRDKQYILYGYGSVGKLIYPLIKNNIKGIIDKSISENFIKVDDLEISIFKLGELTKDDWVIISAFKYSNEIKKELLQYTKNIVEVNLG